MEKLRNALGELYDIDTDFYSMGVMLTALENAYPIEKNAEAFSVVHNLNQWIQDRKKHLEIITEVIDNELDRLRKEKQKK